MKLVTFTHGGTTRIGALTDGGIVDLNATDPSLPADMLALLRSGDAAMATAKAAAQSGSATLSLDDVTLESPIPNPSKILAIGINYEDHLMEVPEHIRKERNLTMPTVPVVFNKQVTSMNAPYGDIVLPPESLQMDYEAELAVIIGKTCRRVSEADALSVIAGYTILNDVTIRDWQLASPTMMMGKSWDTHCPMGPAIVTSDEVADPHNLGVRLTVDGEVRQNFNTGSMYFNIMQQIAHLSTAFTLMPGDIIATGTSAGVAFFRPGHPFLKEGQVVRTEIDGLGYIENKVVSDTTGSFIR